MAVFLVSQVKQIRQICHAYNWVIDLLEILKNDTKDAEKMQVIVFRIEIDTRKFTAKLIDKKVEKAVKAISKILAK